MLLARHCQKSADSNYSKPSNLNSKSLQES